MASILHLAPVGSGKTEEVLALLRALKQKRQSALPKVWVLLATRRQELSFQQRLIEGGPAVYCNIEFFNFRSLNAHLLQRAGQPARRLNNLTRHTLLRELLSEMLAAGQLRFFQRIATTRGFVTVLAALIDELKQNKVNDATFAAAARSEKDQEIARIYRRYQELLKNSDFVDVEGEGWLALALLQKETASAADVDLLLVDGYDQFTPVQAEILAALAGSVKEAHITLTALPAEGAGSLPQRSVLARQRLQAAYAAAGIKLDSRVIRAGDGTRQPALEQLAQKIFRDRPPESPSKALKLIEMPDIAEEVKAVLRAVKAQLLAGAAPEDILLVLRDWQRYAAHFEIGRQEYALPLLLHHQPAYASSPVIAALIDLLQLAPRFRRRDLLDVLRSPYIDAGLSDAEIDLLDKMSLAQQFLGGTKADWLETIDLAQRQSAASSAAELADTQLPAVTEAQAALLAKQLAAFIDGISPPPHAHIRVYINWLSDLLGPDPRADQADADENDPVGKMPGDYYTLKIIKCAYQETEVDSAIARRDLLALDGLQDILLELLASDDVRLICFGGSGERDWTNFWPELKHALENTGDAQSSQPQTGQVLVTTAAEARGLPHAHVYILGLAEGIFPAKIAEDPLYLDSERLQLQKRDIQLETRAVRIDDQGLFYELISLPRASLTLSRPTYQAGKVWIESHLWRAVKKVLPAQPRQRRAVGSVIATSEAANSAELMLALAAQLNGQDAAAAAPALRAKNWLRANNEYAAQWQRIDAGRGLERGRLSYAPFDRYSGILSQPALLTEIARRLSEKRVWSASQLKDYGLCGFRYFAKRLLKLEEVQEPEAGADALQLGLLNHDILAAVYEKIAARGLAIQESNIEAALEILAEVAEIQLEGAPAQYNFRATATWQAEKQVIGNRLAALIKEDFSADSPLNRFGSPRATERSEWEFRAVEIPLPASRAPLRVSGFIDRIDRANGRSIVVDYKSGSRAISRREMEEGRDFQMMLYILALAAQGGAVAGGLFWHLSNRKASGVFSIQNEEDIAAIEKARAHIADNLRQGRAGRFPVHANKLEQGKCVRYCEFSHFCRRQVTNPHKNLPRT